MRTSERLPVCKISEHPVSDAIRNKISVILTVWYFITFWIGRYLADVHGWDLATIGWFAMIPFIVADLGNILGGLFTQMIIRWGVQIPKARKIAAGFFGCVMGLSLISGPLVIVNPASALTVLAIAGFGYAAYLANTMAFPADVVPGNARV